LWLVVDNKNVRHRFLPTVARVESERRSKHLFGGDVWEAAPQSPGLQSTEV
jgi:hypothetical protein